MRVPPVRVFGAAILAGVLCLIALRAWASVAGASSGMTVSGGPTGVLADVRPGSVAWLNGARAGDAYDMLGEEGGGVEVHTADHTVGLVTVLPRLPPLPALAAVVLLVVAMLTRIALPALGASLVLGAVLIAGDGLFGWLPMPWLVVPLLAPFAAVALLAVDRWRGASRLAGPALVVVAVASLLIAGAAFAPEPAFETLWQASRLVPVGVAVILALEALLALAATMQHARPSRVPASVALLRATSIGRRALRLTEEEERDHAAQRVHDQVIPGLALVLSDTSSGTQARAIGAVTDRIRATIMDDQLLVLREGGLAEAIRDVIERLPPGAPRGSLESPELGARPPWDVEIATLRIAQEAINNVRRHASAQTFVVRLEVHPRHLRMAVEDDGGGIDEQVARARPGHLGIRSMESRAREVGGVVTIERGTTRGTSVVFRWPA